MPVLRGLARPTTEGRKQKIITDLRGYPTGNDGRREAPWSRGNHYFHSYQDIFWAASDTIVGVFPEREQARHIKASQACFVKDLDIYLAGFPPEDPDMRQLFQSILEVGSSTYWHRDRPFVKALEIVYKEITEQITKPWAASET